MAAKTDIGAFQSFARLLQPHLARLNASQPPRTRDPRQFKALSSITSGAAAHLLLDGRTGPDFFEQVAYNSRRLAKLNVPPCDIEEALRAYDAELRKLLRPETALETTLQHLHFRTLLTVNDAYYQVRESETQAFYGLLRAEMEATGLDDLLQRFILILTRTFRAQSGRLFPLADPPHIAASVLKRLARPHYIAGGSAAEKLVLDPAMRGMYQSYWSIPYFSDNRVAGFIQLGFPTAYRWLPRELDLLRVFTERCLRAAERARLVQDLAAREKQVRALASRLLEAEHEERVRIGRELHDEAGQSMLFLRLHLEMLEKSAPPDLQPKLAEARAVTERIISELRRIIAALHPSAVAELGLATAIRHLSARFRKLCPVKLRLRLSSGGRPPGAAESAIYRIVQECYQNIAKHASASQVKLSLRSTDKSLELDIEDDGLGFDVDAAVAQPKSFGLRGMRERVALLGGCLKIRSSPGHGAAISVRIPLPAEPASAA